MLIEASVALYRLAGAVLQRYTDARSAAGALDFDDLILKTTSLLSGDHGEAQWVLFKLDGGLDHILVDEAQDTSPEQWQIISSLVREFFAGARRERRSPHRLCGGRREAVDLFVSGRGAKDVCRDGRPLQGAGT